MIDFSMLKNDDFKEDSVRSFIIDKILESFGFSLKGVKDSMESKSKDSKKNMESTKQDSIKIDSKTMQDSMENMESKKDSTLSPTHHPFNAIESNKDSKHKLEIVLSQTQSSKIVVGSNKEIKADLTPDYTLYVDSKTHCILDAKSPDKNIQKDSKAEKQALSYAIAFKTPYYALCNGYKFMLFKTDTQEVLMDIDLESSFNDKADSNLKLLKQYLTTPLQSLRQVLSQDSKRVKKSDEWYLNRPLPGVIPNPKKRAKARHFGNLAYFTRQSWDIVTKNILNFTDVGDVVLDSFGGSGVTAIEAMINGRVGIHTDLNPLSVFMVKALCAKVDLAEFYELSEKILKEFESLRPKNEKEAKEILKNAKYYPNAIDKEFGQVATIKEQESTLWIPKKEILPKGSDVDSVLKLFTKKQLVELAILRRLIFKYTTPSRTIEYRHAKRAMRYSLLLAFYNTINDVNLTYHKSDTGGGDSGVMRYYRYRIAKKPTKLDVYDVFKRRIARAIKGKQELEDSPHFYDSYFHKTQNVVKEFNIESALMQGREVINNDNTIANGEKILQADATNLVEIESNSIDFIYTDPPYGDKIPYLDLSTMWNAWLDFPVDSKLKEKECIEKGSLEKTKYDYYDLMKKSLKEMYRVLKYNRWLAFVFQHQDVKLFQIIVESAENVGFEYAGFVSQEDTGIASFKKVQNPSSVLKGQLIFYFKKIDTPKSRAKV
ncbi:DNA methyltransferase [Helicobacter saguini]|nr:DNA methyltransferase [Helicobacter saguini]MWV70006.1 hypothetical protein [Helicobacter saguini]